MTLHDTWVRVLPMLEPAIRRSPDKPRVLADVMSGFAQLWTVSENGKPIAAIVTRLTTQPVKRCLFWLVGGSRFAEWVETFLAVLKPWARARGCVAFWATGRVGWTRHAARLGWEKIAPHGGYPAWERKF